MIIPEWARQTEHLEFLLTESEKRKEEIKKETEKETLKLYNLLRRLKEVPESAISLIIENELEKKYYNELEAIKNIQKITSIELANQIGIMDTRDFDRKIEHAKNVRIENLAKHYLQSTKKNQVRYKCIFHGGTSQNLSLYQKTNSFHCFVCKESGNPIDFMMKVEKIDFKEAIEKLQYFN